MPISDRDKRTLRIGGIVLGVLLVAFLLLKLLGGGGGAEEGAGAFSPNTTTSTPGGTTGTASGSESPSLAPAVLVPPTRDPFAIPAGFPVSSSGGTTSSGTTSTSTSTSSGGTTTTATTTTTSTSTPKTPSEATQNVGGHQVTLIDVFTTNGVEQATVSVDGVVSHVSAGEEFGPNKQYKLQSVSGNCATFLFGDQAFTLCVPQNK